MLEQFIPVDEVLFVFNSWTLIVKSNWSHLLELEDKIYLFDS